MIGASFASAGVMSRSRHLYSIAESYLTSLD
jgi:hypothetical protein